MIHTQRFNKGFTLIELLVVIAIIGILASVVLASLNSARDKGSDAAVKSNMNNIKAAASMFYDEQGQTYDGVCALTGTSTIGSMVFAAQQAYASTTLTLDDMTASTWDTAQCHDDTNAWAAIAPLKISSSTSPLGWCVDSTGVSKEATTTLGIGEFVCP